MFSAREGKLRLASVKYSTKGWTFCNILFSHIYITGRRWVGEMAFEQRDRSSSYETPIEATSVEIGSKGVDEFNDKIATTAFPAIDDRNEYTRIIQASREDSKTEYTRTNKKENIAADADETASYSTIDQKPENVDYYTLEESDYYEKPDVLTASKDGYSSLKKSDYEEAHGYSSTRRMDDNDYYEGSVRSNTIGKVNGNYAALLPESNRSEAGYTSTRREDDEEYYEAAPRRKDITSNTSGYSSMPKLSHEQETGFKDDYEKSVATDGSRNERGSKSSLVPRETHVGGRYTALKKKDEDGYYEPAVIVGKMFDQSGYAALKSSSRHPESVYMVAGDGYEKPSSHLEMRNPVFEKESNDLSSDYEKPVDTDGRDSVSESTEF